jgi:hypothetical protein
MQENEQQLDEFSLKDIVDRKIRSKIGTNKSKTRASARVSDRELVNAIKANWVKVTRGDTQKTDPHEFASWLLKNIKIDGEPIDKDTIEDAFKTMNIPASGSASPAKAPAAPTPVTPTPVAPAPTKPNPNQISWPGKGATVDDWKQWAEDIVGKGRADAAQALVALSNAMSTPTKTKPTTVSHTPAPAAATTSSSTPSPAGTVAKPKAKKPATTPPTGTASKPNTKKPTAKKPATPKAGTHNETN